MTSKLVDPIHFFDEYGNSMGTHEVLRAENTELKLRNEKLERLNKALLKQRQAADPPEEVPKETFH